MNTDTAQKLDDLLAHNLKVQHPMKAATKCLPCVLQVRSVYFQSGQLRRLITLICRRNPVAVFPIASCAYQEALRALLFRFQ